MKEDKQDVAQIRKWMIDGANVFVKLAKGFGNGNDAPRRVVAILDDILKGGKGSPLSAVVAESEDGAKCAITENTFSMYDFYARYPAHLFENKKEDQSGDEMKESNDQSKFKEICDLAYKATLDGKLKIRMMTSAFIQFNLSNGTNIHYISESSSDKEYKDAIDEINNLYFEEFLINELNDLKKINHGDTGSLDNGYTFKIDHVNIDENNNSIRIIFDSGNFVWATIEILKGATIKQKKVG